MEEPAIRELSVSLARYNVTAVVRLHRQSSPLLTELVWDSLQQPLETVTGHAAYDGEELFCYIPPLEKDGVLVTPPVEDWTMWPTPGDLVFFHRRANERTGRAAVYEFAFMYGQTDLRHYYETGLVGNVIGHLSEGHEAFAAAAAATRKDGSTTIVVARRPRDA